MNTMMLNIPQAIPDRDRFPSFNDDGKRPSTLFYMDLEIAQRFGLRATLETLRDCGDLTKRDPYEVTELYMALSYLMNGIAARHENTIPPAKSYMGKMYSAYEKVYRRIDDEIVPQWTDEAQTHFYRITD